MNIIALIPARMGSTRFPGKPLALLRGKPMIQHVYERTCEVRGIKEVIVATPDLRIRDVVAYGFGGQAILTEPDNATGTDAVAEVAKSLTADIIVNVQGDLPVFDPSMVEEAIAALDNSSHAMMSTISTRIYDDNERQNSHVVKVVVDNTGHALYFSRCPIPYDRIVTPTLKHYRHVGVYVYLRVFLLEFAQLNRTPLEQAECLEQLRALEHGYKIAVSETEHPTIEVDTPEDLARAEAFLVEHEAKAG